MYLGAGQTRFRVSRGQGFANHTRMFTTSYGPFYFDYNMLQLRGRAGVGVLVGLFGRNGPMHPPPPGTLKNCQTAPWIFVQQLHSQQSADQIEGLSKLGPTIITHYICFAAVFRLQLTLVMTARAVEATLKLISV